VRRDPIPEDIVAEGTACSASRRATGTRTYEVSDDDRARMTGRLRALIDRIEAEPKTRGWKLRSKIGERKRWYELPERWSEVRELAADVAAEAGAYDEIPVE
jgi:hypothetical protein